MEITKFSSYKVKEDVLLDMNPGAENKENLKRMCNEFNLQELYHKRLLPCKPYSDEIDKFIIESHKKYVQLFSTDLNYKNRSEKEIKIMATLKSKEDLAAFVNKYFDEVVFEEKINPSINDYEK